MTRFGMAPGRVLYFRGHCYGPLVDELTAIADLPRVLINTFLTRIMNFVPEWAPNVHPMFVHFPIGLLMTAVALDLISLLPRMTPIRRAVPVFYAAGAVTAIATYFTGQAAADGLTISAAAEPILTEHADHALWTVLFFSVYAVVRLIAAKFVSGSSLVVRGVLVLVAAFGLYLIWETAERGSEMVYAHGVGVRQPERVEVARRDTAQSQRAVHIYDGGWTLEPASSTALTDERIRWLVGRPETVSMSDSAGALVLTLEGDTVMFIVDDTLGNVQVSADIDRSSFSGTFTIAYHVQDATTYDFISISGDQMILGRRQGGDVRTFDETATSIEGWSTVRVTGDGTHFRGYVDDQMVVHGHGDPLPPGTAGLRLDGEGTFLIRRIQARAL